MNCLGILPRLMAVMGLGILAASAAKADITLNYTGNTTAGAIVTHKYEAFLAPGTEVRTNDFFTVYDIAGLLAGHAQPSNWTYSTQLTGFTDPSVNPADDASTSNVTWRYTGGTTLLGGVTGLDMGQFTLDSNVTTTFLDNYTSSVHQTSNGAPQNNIGFTQVPRTAPRVDGTPEPGTWALLIGSSLTGIAIIRRRRRA